MNSNLNAAKVKSNGYAPVFCPVPKVHEGAKSTNRRMFEKLRTIRSPNQWISRPRPGLTRQVLGHDSCVDLRFPDFSYPCGFSPLGKALSRGWSKGSGTSVAVHCNVRNALPIAIFLSAEKLFTAVRNRMASCLRLPV